MYTYDIYFAMQQKIILQSNHISLKNFLKEKALNI